MGPKGETGDRGPQGPTGPAGQDGNITVDVDAFETLYPNLSTTTKQALRGEDGADGDNGADGADGAITGPGLRVCYYYPTAGATAATWFWKTGKNSSLEQVLDWCDNPVTTTLANGGHPGNATTAAVGVPN